MALVTWGRLTLTSTAHRRLPLYASKRSVVLTLAPLLYALSAFAQSGVASSQLADQPGDQEKETTRSRGEKNIFAAPISTLDNGAAFIASAEAGRDLAAEVPDGNTALLPSAVFAQLPTWPDPGRGTLFDPQHLSSSGKPSQESHLANESEEDSKIQPSEERLRASAPADFNRDIYYLNKLEFSFDVGWLPINIPFPFDFVEGDPYDLYPLHYTMVPILASLRWQVDDLGGPWILRGNWDISFSGSATLIPRGPETRYFAYIMGFRRNFVPRNSRIAPYWDARLGLGDINAKGPDGVMYAQGQDLTFTLNMGSGVRYNLNPRYGISAGLNWMHVSNANLSQSNGKPNWGIRNYGINVLGPVFGIDIRLRGHAQQSTH